MQSQALENDKKNLKPLEVLVHTDFAENYCISYQNEVMEKHWASVPGVVILTAIVHHKPEGAQTEMATSYPVTSNTMSEKTKHWRWLFY